jgi:hypothetical protein
MVLIQNDPTHFISIDDLMKGIGRTIWDHNRGKVGCNVKARWVVDGDDPCFWIDAVQTLANLSIRGIGRIPGRL